MVTRASQALVMSLLVLSVAVVGCAKRPATTQASAPAPTGGAGTMAGGGAGTAGAGGAGGAGGATGTSMLAQPGGAAGGPGGAGTTASGAARPAPRDFAAIAEMKDIHFDFDKYDIRPGDAKVLDTNAQWLKSNPGHLVLIEGHCDERGTNEYNLALGERRAKSTMNYLVSQGVQANRITIISYGEERPACTEKSEPCWSRNRRAHFLVKPR
ncbi:MAG TPA: peptidoglycan-associated lipoprotein Pal [Methylomirabilota bacterium]|nr:peptidoglycan-associated lipoprotein Pal [Methylomirabilota bacterium]